MKSIMEPEVNKKSISLGVQYGKTYSGFIDTDDLYSYIFYQDGSGKLIIHSSDGELLDEDVYDPGTIIYKTNQDGTTSLLNTLYNKEEVGLITNDGKEFKDYVNGFTFELQD